MTMLRDEHTMKIGIIGFGVVGKAIAGTFSKYSEIIRYDKFVKYDEFKLLKFCDFIFVSVPTPFDCKQNKIDDSAVIESLENLEKLNYDKIVIIKSTVPPGYCDKYLSAFNLDIVFNPEFLRESISPNEDFANQEIVVVGTPSQSIFTSVKNLYNKVLKSNVSYHHTSIIEAEMIKYCQNTMLASRVSLANMIYDACDSIDVNYDKVREIAFDSFEILGPHMVQVPGPDTKRGFGGKCLLKDIRGFSSIYKSDLLTQIIMYNDNLRDDLEKNLKNYKEKD